MARRLPRAPSCPPAAARPHSLLGGSARMLPEEGTARWGEGARNLCPRSGLDGTRRRSRPTQVPAAAGQLAAQHFQRSAPPDPSAHRAHAQHSSLLPQPPAAAAHSVSSRARRQGQVNAACPGEAEAGQGGRFQGRCWAHCRGTERPTKLCRVESGGEDGWAQEGRRDAVGGGGGKWRAHVLSAMERV